jgi:hypothetical protein
MQTNQAQNPNLSGMGLDTKGAKITTAPMVSAAVANQPVKEYTEFIEQPKVQEATQYRTEYNYQEQREAPIKLKEQPITEVEQKTVIQQQPVIVRKQEVQIEKEKPIEIVKHSTDVQTLPAIEKKEMVIQPVEAVGHTQTTINKHITEAGMPADYQIRADAQDARALETGLGETHSSHHSVIDKVKEKVGGAKQAAHGAIEVAREKAREVFSGSGSTTTSKDATMGTTTHTTTSSGLSQQ